MLSGGLAIALTQAFVILIGFLAQRIILSTLTKDAAGFLVLERRVADLIIIILVDFGLNGIAMRRIVQFPDRANEILSTLVAFRIAILVPATLISLVAAQISGYNLADVAMYCVFLGISARSGLIRYALELPFRSNLRYSLVSATSILDAMLFAVLVYLWKDNLSPSTVIQALLLSAIPGFVLFLIFGKTESIRPRFVSLTEMRTLVVEALPVLLVVILMNVHDKIDALILGWFTTPEQVGVFGAAYAALAPVTSTIPMALALAMAPSIARLAIDNIETCRRYAYTAVRFLFVIAVCTSAVMSVLTPIIINLITNDRYIDNQAQFFLFLWMPVPIFLLSFIQELNIAMGYQKRNLPIAWILFTGTVLLGFTIIPMYGSYGAIVAKLLTLVFAASYAISSFTRILAQPLPLLLVLRVLVLIAVGVMASNIIPTLMPTMLAACTSLAIVLVTTALLGIVDKSDVIKVKSLLFAPKG